MYNFSHLYVALIGIEMMAIPSFALIAWNPTRHGALEGSIKYAILASIALAFTLLGIAFIYAGCGTIVLNQLVGAMLLPKASAPLCITGMTLMLVGIGFELAVVPFHSWLADVTQAAPAPVMALMTGVSKIAMLIFMLHFAMAIAPAWPLFEPLLWALAAASISVGTLLALRQDNIKRILAYSSTAQMGYLLMALASLLPISSGHSSSASGLQIAAYYAGSYAIMNLMAFAALGFLSRHSATGTLQEYRGLGRRYPWIGIAMAVAILSLAGIPPTAGFFAKFYLFAHMLGSGDLGWTIFAALCSAVSVFFYLRILLVMFAPIAENATRKTTTQQRLSPNWALHTVLATGAMAVIIIGIFAQPIMHAMQHLS